VNYAREFLARLVERIEIDRAKNVVMKVKADWLLPDTHSVNTSLEISRCLTATPCAS
jgi:hypothetical protein